MNMNRFFVSGSSIEGDRVRLSPEQAHQVCHVLRLAPGDTIIVLDDSGTEYEVGLTTVGLPETVGQVTARRRARGEPAVRLVLFQSMLSREKFEWVLQKGTEVGVGRFTPVVTERSIVHAKLIEEKKLNRWRRIVTEAAEQSHRGRIPAIDQIIPFSGVLAQLADFDRSLIAAPFDQTVALSEALRGVAEDASIALLVGPEGGFTPEEAARAKEKGAIVIRLGPRVLRTETAALVASALILHELGALEP